jgi:trans-AT polyketide synthase/acyltransferase/oxidoreductase domain-containing protein
MGAELFDTVPEFRAVEAQVDAVLGYSLRRLCLDDPERQLSNTRFTQPALFVVNALHYYRAIAEGARPLACAGHSLGEYNALLAAGAFDLLTGLRIVQRRAALMAEASGGGMGAVIGLAPERIAAVLSSEGLDGIDVANFNSANQTVISGPLDQLRRAGVPLQAAGAAAVVQLPVSAAFHSRYMAAAASSLGDFLEQVDFQPLTLPVIANVTAEPIPDGATAASVRALLVRQMREPVQWSRTMRYLRGLGSFEWRELGPGNVLTRLAAQPDPSDAAPAPGPATAKAVPAAVPVPPKLTLHPARLGSAAFRADYGLRLAYLCGAMYKGIASVEMVVALGKAGLMGFLGTGGMSLDDIETSIARIRSELGAGQPFGLNLLAGADPAREAATVALYLKHGVRHVEAAAYVNITPGLVRFRLHGACRDAQGKAHAPNRIVAKVSRPEVAVQFMRPAPAHLVEALVAAGHLSRAEASLASELPLAQDICVEADSGGHTDQGVAYALMPAMQALRNEIQREQRYHTPLRIGAAGGIGTPEAAAAAFILGADFVVTGSINQCTVEAGTSDAVKDMLQKMNVQDTAYAPAGDMFELGAKVQVLRRGLFFPMRANRLHELYMRHDSLESIDEPTLRQIEEKYFKRSIAEVWDETRAYYERTDPAELAEVERTPKRKMALVFRWYFIHASRLALSGSAEQRVDYQVQCGPALGAFNQWVKDTPREPWRARRVAELGDAIMAGAAEILEKRFAALAGAEY